jgi:ELP3 family radical SAM enzyme/protein acetyltransferase
VQLGVQHIDDDILKGINRQCTTERFKRSLRLLKDVGYKVDIHIMANLPFSSPERDRVMLIDRFLGMRSAPVRRVGDGDGDGVDEIIEYDIAEPDLSADQWKLYPCETVPYTEIEKWYREGTYVPYAKEALYDLLYDTKKAMYPWIRCNRIIRDIPKGYIIASSDDPNTGQQILDDLRARGDVCMCIRCREVKERKWDGSYKLRVRLYKASGGDEYFISAESDDEIVLYGFIRLRIRSEEGAVAANEIFPELFGCALIRELHVYGVMSPVGAGGGKQHKGVGKVLLTCAEHIAKNRGCGAVSVISGVGVQRYYERHGYLCDSEGRGHFMIKYFGDDDCASMGDGKTPRAGQQPARAL